MEEHKWRALHRVLQRHKQDIKIYLVAMEAMEEGTRACYELPVSWTSEQFMEMMVLDRCFILELFRGAVGGFKALGYAMNDPVFSMRGTISSIQRDMIMLKNQIPLFVLEKLLSLQLLSANPSMPQCHDTISKFKHQGATELVAFVPGENAQTTDGLLLGN
ncbi:hypothetical protein Droror1_Dr00006627 [Drosera rotundifolia]